MVELQVSASVVLEVLTAFALLILAVYFPWHNLNRQASLIGSSFLIVCALLMATHSLEIGASDPIIKSYLMGTQMVWGLLAGSFWFMYILHYLALRRWQLYRFRVLFSLMPLLVILAVATNSASGLLWTDPGLDLLNPYLPLKPAYGWFYWISMFYLGILTIFGSFLIFQHVIRKHDFKRWEPWALIGVAVTPLISAFLEVTRIGLPTNLTIGITPFLTSSGAVVLIWSLPNFQVQKVAPLARHVVFERIGDCVLVLDMKNLVVDLNPAAERLTGHSRLDSIGLSIERIMPDWPDSTSVPNSPAVTRQELVLKSATGQKTYELRMYSISDERHQAINKVALLTDITELKEAVERQHWLYEKEKALREELEKEAKARALFMDILAHELRTPLTPMLISSAMLLEIAQNESELIKKLSANIHASSKNLGNRLEELLDMARFARGTFILSLQPVIIPEFITGVVSRFKSSLDSVKQNLIVRVEPGLPKVNLDPSRLEQVIVNLLSNASKFSPPGSDIALAAYRKNGNLGISIQDRGIGITPEDQKTLFEPYHRVQQDRNIYPGTGLGLAICKQIVEAHGGQIRVDSVNQNGSTFFFEIPLNGPHQDAK